MQKMIFQCTLFLAVSFVLAFPALGQVQLFSHPLTESLRVPFTGTVSVPLTDATTDTVALTGVLTSCSMSCRPTRHSLSTPCGSASICRGCPVSERRRACGILRSGASK
jgi:hypothetical protein